MTLAEHHAQMKADGTYDAMIELRRQQDAERQKRVAELRLAEAPLVEELRAAGFQVDSAWDLVNTTASYPAAIPVLLAHLHRPYPEKTKEGIARALAVPEAKDGWDILLAEFENNPDTHPNGYKWAVGVALGVLARETRRYEEALRLLRDKRHGENRSALLGAIAFAKDKAVRPLIAEFVDDPVLGEDVRWQLKHPGRRRR